MLDWDSVYKQESDVIQGPAPWNIGEPQPALAELIRQGRFRGDVLDAGCGFAEVSLSLAAKGYTVVGIDITPTAVDSTLFHSLPVELRDDYLRAVYRAAAPGASYFILVFAKGAFPAELAAKPNEVTDDELRTAVAKYRIVDDIRPASIHTLLPQFSSAARPVSFPPFEIDEKGRPKLAAWLLTAHKPD
jgi:hypothetical protein